MQMILRTPNLELSPRETKYLEKKINNFEKYAHNIADESSKIYVDVEQTDIKTSDKKLKLHGLLYVPHAYLRAEVFGLTFEEAVDLFEEKMKHQIERYKEKSNRRDRTGKWIKESTLEKIGSIAGEFEDTSLKITKRKDFSNERFMHEEEACEQMELLAHNFFVFYNIDKDCFSVVYKRKDGNYGIIDTKQPS